MILFLKNYTSSIVLFLIFFLLLGLLIIKFPKKYTEEQFVVNKTKYKNIWMYWEISQEKQNQYI